MVANLFGNVCYLCFPSPATIYVLPECIERLFVWRAQIHAVGIAQAFKMRRNSVILLHGFEAALNDNWSVPICPFFPPQVSGWGDRDRDLILSSAICTLRKKVELMLVGARANMLRV